MGYGSSWSGTGPLQASSVVVIDSVTGQTIEITPQGNSTISFWNATHTDRAFINAPGGNKLGVDGFQYASTIAPGTPTVRPRLFMVPNGTFLEVIDGTQTHVGPSVALQDSALQMTYYDSNHVTEAYQQFSPAGIKWGSDLSSKTLKLDTTAGMNLTVDVWHSIGVENSWGITIQPQYMIMPDGTVRMRGIIFPGSTGDGTEVMALPAGYGPNVEANVHIAADAAPNNIFKITTAGGAARITVFNIVAGNYYLDGLSWSTLSA